MPVVSDSVMELPTSLWKDPMTRLSDDEYLRFFEIREPVCQFAAKNSTSRADVLFTSEARAGFSGGVINSDCARSLIREQYQGIPSVTD